MTLSLLQLVIEEVTGETFSTYMQDAVLDPLGMVHSSFEWRADLRPATAVAYNESEVPLPNYLFTEKAAAGLYTTALDLARFVAAGMADPNGEPAGRGVLAPDTLTVMFTPAIQLQGQDAWGLGHQISTLPDGSRTIGHGGANAGWRAYFVEIPEQGLGVVVLTNSDNGMALVDNVVSVCGDELLP
jgi:CubicO group peptidase (beta-lactamase class C family)